MIVGHGVKCMCCGQEHDAKEHCPHHKPLKYGDIGVPKSQTIMDYAKEHGLIIEVVNVDSENEDE